MYPPVNLTSRGRELPSCRDGRSNAYKKVLLTISASTK